MVNLYQYIKEYLTIPKDCKAFIIIKPGFLQYQDEIFKYCADKGFIMRDHTNPTKLTNKQIKDFLAEGYTASGILKTLIYGYEIKHNDISKAMGGIGIVPYVYKQALDYYYNLYLAEMANVDKDIDEYRPKEIFISIDLPKKEKELKLWEDEDE